ncbi:M20_dimer domain-containing protein [Hyphomicrobiales bacterium]|nr:M20_dimer domain-containing protein [Hyphomicrobiales bacterium]CAH1697820.1 M20_dimer domain-containing protein [Hyphomicrobiales bacterium]CAI0347466.1 M20_dimer domain-containing protein [Hyphomicrobiales bacterium]
MTDTDQEQRLRRAVEAYIADGRLLRDLSRRVAMATPSGDRSAGPALHGYLADEIVPTLDAMGFVSEIVVEPDLSPLPVLIARREEAPDLPTILLYGHGDVVQADPAEWSEGLDPWVLTRRSERLYGRGSADNKGQHSVNLAALSIVLAERGHLGFNTVLLMEMGEEAGSPGLEAFCRRHRDALKADLLIASDGPRWSSQRPTLFLGARGVIDLEISVSLRERAYHSGNWGGWLRNAGQVLTRALALLADAQGRPIATALETPAAALAYEPLFDRLLAPGEAGLPEPDAGWGDVEASPAARLLNRNNLEIIALDFGDVERPVYAIGPRARALCQVSFLPETDPATFAPAFEAIFRQAGLDGVEVRPTGFLMPASRTAPDHPVVAWALAALERWSGKSVDLLPNFGGALPNWIFRNELNLPTLWVPHSYNGCAQHAPDEHALKPILDEGLLMMAGLFWEAGAKPERLHRLLARL